VFSFSYHLFHFSCVLLHSSCFFLSSRNSVCCHCPMCRPRCAISSQASPTDNWMIFFYLFLSSLFLISFFSFDYLLLTTACVASVQCVMRPGRACLSQASPDVSWMISSSSK
jgi:hypothetical protein